MEEEQETDDLDEEISDSEVASSAAAAAYDCDLGEQCMITINTAILANLLLEFSPSKQVRANDKKTQFGFDFESFY